MNPHLHVIAKQRKRAAGLLFLVALTPGIARGEEPQVRLIEDTGGGMESRGQDLHPCYAAALAGTPDLRAHIRIVLSVTDGRVVTATAHDVSGADARMVECVLARARHWPMPLLREPTRFQWRYRFVPAAAE